MSLMGACLGRGLFDFEQLLELRLVSRQQRGWLAFMILHSKRYERRWRWVRKRMRWKMDEITRDALTHLCSKGVASPTTIFNHEAAQRINMNLTEGATIGVLVDFSDDDGRAFYTHDKIQARSRIASTVLLMDNPVMQWVRYHLFLAISCRVASIGGGPGFDALSLAFIKHHFRLPYEMEVNVYDIEPKWRKTVDALRDSRSVDPVLLSFETGDIRSAVETEENSKIAASLPHVNLFLFNYVCVENAAALQEKDHPFLRSLFNGARSGAVMVFTDTSDRLWPQVAALGGEHFLSFLLVLKSSCPKVALVMVKCGAGAMTSHLASIARTAEAEARNSLGERCMFVNGLGVEVTRFLKIASERQEKCRAAADRRAQQASIVES